MGLDAKRLNLMRYACFSPEKRRWRKLRDAGHLTGLPKPKLEILWTAEVAENPVLREPRACIGRINGFCRPKQTAETQLK